MRRTLPLSALCRITLGIAPHSISATLRHLIEMCRRAYTLHHTYTILHRRTPSRRLRLRLHLCLRCLSLLLHLLLRLYLLPVLWLYRHAIVPIFPITPMIPITPIPAIIPAFRSLLKPISPRACESQTLGEHLVCRTFDCAIRLQCIVKLPAVVVALLARSKHLTAKMLTALTYCTIRLQCII